MVEFRLPPMVAWEIPAVDITVSQAGVCCFGDVDDRAALSMKSWIFM
jgi:hypothetical protein